MNDAGFPGRVGADADTAEEQTIGGGFAALLAELAHLLERFSDSGERRAIDLRSLPLAPGEYDHLHEILGRGEVTVTLGATEG